MTHTFESNALAPCAVTADDGCVRLNLESAEVTAAFSARLARATPWSPDGRVRCVYLHGELGAGKTSVAQGVLRALGVEGRIPSPSYTLVEPYDTPYGRVLHVDLYRLNSADELEALGVRDEWLDCALLLVEWPEKGGSALPPCDLRIELVVAGQGRAVTLFAASEVGRRWLAGVCGNAVEGTPR